MTGVLFFKDSRGNMRLVNSTISEDNIYPEMIKYIEKLNPNFHVYYIRSWDISDNTTKFDVGSHTEFFFFSKQCCANCKHFLDHTCCTKGRLDNCCGKWEAK